MTEREQLELGSAELGLVLNAAMKDQLLGYLRLLEKWNKVYNLTAIRRKEQMVSHHLLDSLAVVPHLWPGKWLDVGCGGGLPGLVLAMVRPEWSVTLLDSNSKKTSFVQQAIIELGLKNAMVHCARVEEFEAAEKFDGIISRAFTETADFVRITRHLLATGGQWAAMKGVPEQELQRLPADVEVARQIQLQVPGLNAARCLVVLRAK